MRSRRLLTIELMPKDSWGRNLSKTLGKRYWNLIRREVYQNANYRCEICCSVGLQRSVECHEIWEYDDCNKIQKLSGFIALCPSCHHAKHFAIASKFGKTDEAFNHLMEVNNWTEDQAREYIKSCFDLWEERSKYQWHIDITILQRYGIDLPIFPESIEFDTNTCEKPSEITDKYWVYARNYKPGSHKHSGNGGKWIVYVNVDDVDMMWYRIKDATEKGLLGTSSKCATAKENGYDSKARVICVYTYNCDDSKDIMRIRNELWKLGITNQIAYKSNRSELDNENVRLGHKSIDKL